MKYILMTLLMGFIYIVPTQAQEKTNDVVVQVDGMVCDFCAQSLEKVFGKEKSVNGIDVSLDDQTVTIDTKDDEMIDDTKIKELIEWGGYDLVSIERPS